MEQQVVDARVLRQASRLVDHRPLFAAVRCLVYDSFAVIEHPRSANAHVKRIRTVGIDG